MRTMKLALLADTTQFSKGLKTATSKTMTFGDKVKNVAKGIGLAFAGIATAAAGFAVKIGIDAVMAASDFEEALNAMRVVFGKGAKDIEAFSKTASSTFGQSQTQAMQAATTFATFGKAAGLTGTKLTGFAKKLTVLASDLASFKNTTPEEAITAIGAALRGESEPIRQYGVLLNDATMKAYAFSKGLYNGKGSLDIQTKVLAAYGEILSQTTDAQGDFINTQNGAANTMKTLTALTQELYVSIGQALLPTFTTFVNWLKTEGVPGIQTFIDVMKGGNGKTLQQAILSSKKDMDGLTYGAMSDNQAAFVGLAESVKAMGTAFGKMFEKLELNDPKGNFNTFINGLSTAADFMAKIAEGAGYVTGLGKSIVTVLTGGGADFDGKRAMGGSVLSGKSYLVGERGPEIFTPSGSGNITPNHRMGGGVTINVYGAADSRESARAITRALQKVALNGGTNAGVVGFA